MMTALRISRRLAVASAYLGTYAAALCIFSILEHWFKYNQKQKNCPFEGLNDVGWPKFIIRHQAGIDPRPFHQTSLFLCRNCNVIWTSKNQWIFTALLFIGFPCPKHESRHAGNVEMDFEEQNSIFFLKYKVCF